MLIRALNVVVMHYMRWPVVKKVSLWKPWELDFILCQGNDLYKNLGYTSEYLHFDDLPQIVPINNDSFIVERLSTYDCHFERGVESINSRENFHRKHSRN